MAIVSRSVGKNVVHRQDNEGPAVYLIAEAVAIDADGSPRAYGPRGGLDYIDNAKAGARKDGRWVGIRVGPDGSPVVQGPSDPAPGMFVSPTALRVPDGDPDAPATYLDSEVVPYLAIGGKFLAAFGAAMGDLAWVIDTSSGDQLGAIVGDSPGGASVRAHEVSIAVARRLGYVGDPKGHGRDPAGGVLLVALFPGSASSPAWPRPDLQETAAKLLAAAGGAAAIYATAGLPTADAPSPPTRISWGPIVAVVLALGFLSLATIIGGPKS